ncbi:MAG: dUTP diphosphatase [Tissierellia bacterium]|nr:dUTP diphosphatase [Tissierellia bacterium]
MSNVKIKMIVNSKKPSYASLSAAGMDLYSYTDKDIIVKPNETVKVHTGVSVEIPEGYFGGVYPRSSTGVKKHLMLANTIGVIDSDYRGEIMVFFYNYGSEDQVIKNGDRLAQLIIQPYQRCQIELVDKLSETKRGESGFGSTGE